LLASGAAGLDTEEAEERLLAFGPNVVVVFGVRQRGPCCSSSRFGQSSSAARARAVFSGRSSSSTVAAAASNLSASKTALW
jgi:hypothetical protein